MYHDHNSNHNELIHEHVLMYFLLVTDYSQQFD